MLATTAWGPLYVLAVGSFHLSDSQKRITEVGIAHVWPVHYRAVLVRRDWCCAPRHLSDVYECNSNPRHTHWHAALRTASATSFFSSKLEKIIITAVLPLSCASNYRAKQGMRRVQSSKVSGYMYFRLSPSAAAAAAAA
jgi:hypothetical protein